MNLQIDKMISSDDPVMQDAIKAMKHYHEAWDTNEPRAVVENLRLTAEQQFQTISDYHLSDAASIR